MTVHHVKTLQFVYHTRALVFVALCLLFSLVCIWHYHNLEFGISHKFIILKYVEKWHLF